MMSLEELQTTFSSGNTIAFEQLENGIVLAKIDNSLATATVSLYGGHIVEWRPKHQAVPVLWRSRLVQFIPGKAIRSGVPVCWPWFGPHPTDPTLPSHGYARVSPWQVTSVSTGVTGATEIVMTMLETDSGRQQQDFFVRLTIRMVIADVLSISLTTTNLGKQDIVFSEALHAYLNISDIANVQVTGLNGCEYVDSTRGNVHERQSGPVTFSERLDRIYLNTKTDCLINDPGWARSIKVTKSGSLSTVVWNPWLATASKMDDLGHEGWRTMVCVESANALANRSTVKAGASHTLGVTYSVENL